MTTRRGTSGQLARWSLALLAVALLGVPVASAQGGGVVDGYVTDAGHGYPLYAFVELKQGATQVAATFTSPFSGYFELSIEDGSYDLVVTAVYAGYDLAQQPVTVAGVDQTVGVVLDPDASCLAQGYVDDGGCVPVPGGLVAGFVTDGNNGSALVGAEVADDLGGSVASETTGDDEAIGDGFFALFTAIEVGDRPNGPATRVYTASMEAYADLETEFVVVPNTVSRLDFAMPAGMLSFAPASLKARLNPGQEEHQDLSLVNSGAAEADFTLLTLPVAPAWPHRSPAAPVAALPASADGTSVGRAPALPTAVETTTGGERALDAVPGYGVDLSSSNVVYWPTMTTPATWTVQAGVPGTAYFAGDFLLGDFSTLYVLDFYANELRKVLTANGATTVVGAAAAGSGQAWTGLTASASGMLYAAGTTCGGSTLYTIDATTAAVTAVGTITNAPCIIDIAINAAGQMYGVDILNDVLVGIDPATGAGTVIGPLGVDVNYAQGMDFDEVSGILYWAAYTSTSGGELRTINTATGASTLIGAFPGGAEVDSLAIATVGVSGLPWLVLTPTEGTVAGASSFPIDAHFIADGATHFGLHQGTIRGTENTPYALPDVPVCFTRAFLDVPEGAFADVFIHAIAGAQITSGCGNDNFCPNDAMTRATMAPWLLKSRFGSGYTPPACTGVFSDVPCSDLLAPWIEALYAEGITSGCFYDPGTGERRYCPGDAVTRAQMAVFLLKAKEGSAYAPPACAGVFADVPCPGGFAVDWIEEIFARGITAGCGGGNFCPDASSTRAQMAVFITKNWSLPTCQ
ncbi:MAG: DUF4394 domain-containing protein [Acidobacteriota bacterium]